MVKTFTKYLVINHLINSYYEQHHFNKRELP